MRHSQIMERFSIMRGTARMSNLELTTDGGSTFTVKRGGQKIFHSPYIMVVDAFLSGYAARGSE